MCHAMRRRIFSHYCGIVELLLAYHIKFKHVGVVLQNALEHNHSPPCSGRIGDKMFTRELSGMEKHENDHTIKNMEV